MTRSRTLANRQENGRFLAVLHQEGNLSMIAITMSTSLDIDADGIIMFIEVINEPLYGIDRLLTHLRLAGKLSRLCVENEVLAQLLKQTFEPFRIPVLAG
jgi:muramoyltetrapeptide carboxypeptidase